MVNDDIGNVKVNGFEGRVRSREAVAQALRDVRLILLVPLSNRLWRRGRNEERRRELNNVSHALVLQGEEEEM
jgi:hypothetical protein